MKLDAGFVGTPLEPYRTTIHWRQTTNFAAAIRDGNPAYFDDCRAAGIVAHPMFAVSVTWPVVSRLDRFIAAEAFPKDILMTQVHYTEHLMLHRLIRPGDELCLTGDIRALLPHRAGTHAIIALDAKDRRGRAVFTEYIGAMLRGVDCRKGGRSGPLPRIPESGESGADLWRSKIHIDPLQPYVYDGCSNISFPIHTSPEFAQAVGLPGIILQGTATLAYAVRELVDHTVDGDPARVAEISCRFTGMVRPGTDIRVCCTGRRPHADATDFFFHVINADEQTVVRDGYVKMRKTAVA